MTNQLLFYADAKPVSVTEHKDLSVKTGADYGFAAKVNSVPLTAAELPAAALEYAIVFAGNDDQVVPLVILGAQKEQNLYVDDDGRWRAKYIPAFVRRYPFVFAQSGDGKNLTLCIDEGFSGCNREGRGERLFDAEGSRTAYLEQVINFQRAYQVQHQRTQAFCKRLVELGLLAPVQAQLGTGGGERRVLSGLRVVNRTKLKELDAETLHGLMQRDELELIYLHLHSLANLRLIGERMPQPATGAEADTAPASGADEAAQATKH
jgi:hypothetical protein